MSSPARSCGEPWVVRFLRQDGNPGGIYSFSMAGDHRSERHSESASGQRASGAEIDWPVALAQHERWLRTVVLARVGEHAACDDVMQQVALAAMAKGHQLRDLGSIGPWLYRLAVVEALQYRRRQGRRRSLMQRFAERVPPTDCDTREADPLDWLLADERQALVRQALRCLPPRDAEILLLKYSEDWSYRQLAEHLGLSHSAVEARLHRARRRLRQALARLDATMVMHE